MPGLLEILGAEEAGRVWIGQPGRTSSRSKMREHRRAERKAKTVTQKMTDHVQSISDSSDTAPKMRLPLSFFTDEAEKAKTQTFRE